jgi:hypothetical protein
MPQREIMLRLTHALPLVEIWTRRSIYRIDARLACIQVADRATGSEQRNHRCIGARLGGGRTAHGEQVIVTFPLPVPGARAFFQDRCEHAVLTGTVERVLVQTSEVMLQRTSDSLRVLG